MGLELVTGIWDFNTSWPLPTDKRRQGDDHLRAIKLGTKNTFPNISAPVTASDEILNAIPASLNLILAELLNHIEAPGSVKMHDLANKPIPTGWHLCDGSVVVGYGTVPDMRDRFIVSSGPSYVAQTVGGDNTALAGGSHAHGGTTGSHVLTTPEIPSHTHTLAEQIFIDEADVGTPIQYLVAGSGRSTGATGGGGGHTHDISTQADHTHNLNVKYYAAVFIVKTATYTAP